MIDTAALGRHVAAQIAHFPVTIKVDGVELSASFRSSKAMLNALDGGVVNFGGGSLVILKSAVATPIAAGVGRIEVKKADASWNSYAIASVEGYEDPLATELNVIVEPAEGEG